MSDWSSSTRTRRIIDTRFGERPLLDIVSYGRSGPSTRRLTPAFIAQASRTVRRVPEVMVKVSGGARSVRGVVQHLSYLEQRADLETDQGERMTEKGLGRQLLEDWNLDLEEHRRHTARSIAAGRKPPKLVHNLVFSMPKGTPEDKLYKAVKKFAFEKFDGQHRYAMAMHTDQANPHVHVVVKALSEEGERLNIRKATLREWRYDFARYLRDHGVEANATERAVRGAHQRYKDSISHAARRGASTFLRSRSDDVARELMQPRSAQDRNKESVLKTRSAIEEGWRAFAMMAEQEGLHELARQTRDFVAKMPPARTDRERIAAELLGRLRALRKDDASPTR